MIRPVLFSLVILLLFPPVSVFGQEVEAPREPEANEYLQMSLEDLMDIEITSVSRKEEKLSESPAAVFVITNEDIRRSGATSIPEALRMAPGVNVARIDSNRWAVTARGFNGRLANKLLVLIDGRTVYTPAFSGVFWDMQDVLLEDVERIEVIRGPGATMWGANAVNGVINIITKDARDTQGAYVSGGGGTQDRGFVSARYGGKINDNGFYRVYGMYFDRKGYLDRTGGTRDDAWNKGQMGIRTDWELSESDTLTVQGDAYLGRSGFTETEFMLTPPFRTLSKENDRIEGGNLVGRWKRTISDEEDLGLQIYLDRLVRDSEVQGIETNTLDLDWQHRFNLAGNHEIVWGLGYRLVNNEFDNNVAGEILFDPDSRNIDLMSAFVQDSIRIDERARLILGSKFEYNDFTQFEIQPSARLVWTPGERSTLWAAVSRAVRTPSIGENDASIRTAVFPDPGGSGLPIETFLNGDRDFDSEDLVAWEMGYRQQATDWLSVDVAAFLNVYDNLRTLEPGTPSLDVDPIPHLVLPFTADNKMDGETYGVEIAADARPRDWWRLQLSYSFLQMQLHRDSDSRDITAEADEGKSPHNQVSFRSMMDLPWNLTFDSWLRYVDNLPAIDVDKYITLDLRLGWHATENLEVFVVGQYLLDREHPEFVGEILDVPPTEIERGVYAGVTLRF